MPLPHPGDLYFTCGECWLILKPTPPYVDMTYDGRLIAYWVLAANQTEQIPPMPILIAAIASLRPHQDIYIQRASDECD